jgi:uncharacterized RDD family membrane protein YckC
VTLQTNQKKKDPPPTFKGHYAGFISRLIAFVIDILIVSITIGILLGTVVLILNFFNFDFNTLTADATNLNNFIRGFLVFFTGFGFTFTVNLIYDVFFWMVTGKTIGKMVMGLRVIGPKGARITFGRALRRYVGYWISALPLFLGYFWVLINDDRHAWHDMIGGTSVIYDHDAQYTEAGLGRLAHYTPKVEGKVEQKRISTTSSMQIPSQQAVIEE